MGITRRKFIQGAAVAGGLAAIGGPASALTLTSPRPRLSASSFLSAPIDHIVVVMMENRSFDHFLGWLPTATGTQQATYLDEAGVPHDTHHLAAGPNPDYAGCGHTDPDHGWNGGRLQLGPNRDASGFRKGRNDDFAIGYYTGNDLPVWKALTEQATIFDHYFTGILGPTYPNRWYMHAATSGGRKSNDFPTDPYNGWPETTIWERLQAAGVSWGYYFSNLPVIGLYGARVALSPNVRHIAHYYADAAAGRLPQVSFVDPFFVVQGLANDDHPHADVRLGQQFLAGVIRAFTHSPNWSNGALFVNYDEWGGFFDTVVPPRAPDDDRANATDINNDFAQLGFRTPATVVSPYARRGHIDTSVYEHTSILRFIESRYGLTPLTRRDATAPNIGAAFDFENPDFSEPEIPAYMAPPEARIPCEVKGHAAPPNELNRIATSGFADALKLRTDYRFEDSFASF